MENKSWSDITLETYIEIIEAIDGDCGDNDIVSIILDISLSDVENMEYDDYLSNIEKVQFIYTPISDNYKNLITIDGYKFHSIELDRMEFGAFIDIEYLLKESYLYNLPKIYSILYRQVIEPATRLKRVELEPYGDWLDIRQELFNKALIEDVYGFLSLYIRWRDNIFKTYEGLFSEEEEELDESEENEMLKEMTGKEREEYYKEKNVASYGWELMILRLSGNDPTKMLESTSMPVLQALNTLGMMNTLKIG